MRNLTTKRGYTLLELIVSLGIFSLVMVVVTGAYVTLISLDRHARSQNQLVASLSFAIESMSRNMRTGTGYICNGNSAVRDCNAGTSITFTDSEGSQITFFKKNDGTIGQCTGSPCTQATAVSLTDPLITIDSLTFYVRGACPQTGGVGSCNGDGRQPQATFVVKGSMAAENGEISTFSIQSSATQRLIDL